MIKFSIYPLLLFLLPLLISGCAGEKSDKRFSGKQGEVQLMILDPGHFHAGLVQKTMYDQISPTVHVFAPPGAEVDDYLRRVEQYNTRAEKPKIGRAHV